jgi:hypothetical protein
MAYRVHYDIELPKKKVAFRTPRESVYNFDDMGVGGSFFITDRTLTAITNAVGNARKRTGFNLTIRKDFEHMGLVGTLVYRLPDKAKESDPPGTPHWEEQAAAE